MITQAPRGTKDWFGKDMDQRTYLENIFKDLCASYNIHEIITPVFEHTEHFSERCWRNNRRCPERDVYI